MENNNWDKSKHLTIGSLAKLFGLNTSTLRFWEKKGLLNAIRNSNNYRRYDYQSLLDVCDLILMKNMGLTIDDMRKAPSLGLHELESLYDSRITALKDQVRDLHEILSKIHDTKDLMAEFNTLCLCEEIIISEPDILQLIPHKKLDDPTVWRKYFSGQYQFGFVFNPGVGGRYDESWGWIPKTPEPAYQSVWNYELGSKTFAQCTMWVNVEDRSKNSIEEIKSLFNTHNYRIGSIVARYICTAHEYGCRNDFYKAWVEIY